MEQNKRYLSGTSLWAKIILPYFLLTLLIAGVGTFALTSLFTSSLQDRINNQLIDAGTIVSEGIVRFEDERLQTVRAIAATEGVAEAIAAGDNEQLAGLVPQIALNNKQNVVELIDMNGVGIFGWQQLEQSEADPIVRRGTDWSTVAVVQSVLEGQIDTQGDKFTFLAKGDDTVIVYTIGPVFVGDEQVGAVMVGTDLDAITFNLTLNAVARVTFYDPSGNVLSTTLTGGQDDFLDDVATSGQFVDQVIETLEGAPVLLTNPTEETNYRNISVLGQSYQLAYGEWRLRGDRFGLFSVAVPRNPVESAVRNGRILFVTLFTITMAGVFFGGVLIAKRITRPIDQLVETATAVTAGNLTQRSGITGTDEIGQLATAFDTMTDTLAQRNRQLLEQASKLEAIVDSIADGVIVVDQKGEIVTLNPAAAALLQDMSTDFFSGPLRELSESFTLSDGDLNQEAIPDHTAPEPRQYMLGNRVLSALAAPVRTPAGEQIGSVIVMRDVTREVESDELKDAFITSVSHELRTPLSVIKLSSDLIRNSLNGHAGDTITSLTNNLMKGIGELEHHINQLINISEIQAGTLRLNRMSVPLSALVQQINEQWITKFKARNLQFETIYEDGAANVSVDVSHISWALDNLLENALNYTPKDGSVKVKVYTKGSYGCIDVIDNGIGIAKADQAHLFDRFFRAHNRENYAARGVGLGLYISKSIAELHGGYIAVESDMGQGSRFTLGLPLVVEMENEPA